MCYWLAYVPLVNTCTSMSTVRGTCRHASSCSMQPAIHTVHATIQMREVLSRVGSGAAICDLLQIPRCSLQFIRDTRRH